MFSKLFGCFKNGKSFRFPEMDDKNDSRPMAVDQSLPTLGAEEVRTGVFRQILKLRRRTKHEEILLYEKRYLKKYLRHQNIYVSGMTVPEMRKAKRLLLEPENRKDFCLHCCHCFDCYCRADPKNAAKDGNVEQVTVDGKFQAAVQFKESEGGECSQATTAATTVKEERGSDENQDTPAKEKVGDENLSASESKDEEEPSATTMTSEVNEESLGAESSVMETIESAEIPSVLESTEEVDGECPMATVTEVDCDSQETTPKKNCELQSEAKQTLMTSDDPEPFAKEKMQSKSDEEPLKEACEETQSLPALNVACGDIQEITAQKNCDQQSVEDPLKPTTGGESKGSESSEAKLTAVPGDDPEQLAKEKVEIYAKGQSKELKATSCDSQEITMKMECETDEKIQLQQSSEEPLQRSTGDGKEGEECSEARQSTVSVDELQPPAKEKIPAQSVDKQSKETNGNERGEGKLIIDKTGKMTPEEVVRNNELHAIVLKWFESQEEVLSFIGGSDDGRTYVSLEQPEP